MALPPPPRARTHPPRQIPRDLRPRSVTSSPQKSRTHILSRQYAVVIANPPYMGAKNMGDRLTRFLRSEYPTSKADLFAAFISRCRSFAMHRGMVAMITMQSWMFLQSFEPLRQAVVKGREISVLAHLGSGAFDSIGGDVVSTCAFVLAGRHSGRTTFLRLTSAADESGKRNLLRDLREPNTVGRYDLDLAALQEIPGTPLSYWLNPSLVAAFDTSDRLEDLAPVCQGLATADSSRFVRAWVEVSASNIGIGLPSREAAQASGRRWFPENKGGPSRRWYGNQWHILDWDDDGAELFGLRPKSVIRNSQHYFKPAVSWSAVGASTAFRYYPTGFIFDNAGMSVIPPDEPTAMYLLGCLNSSVMGDIVSALAPTMNLNAGTVADLPIPVGERAEIAEAARKAVEVSRADWIAAETSWEFKVSPLVAVSGPGQLFRDRVAGVRDYHAQLARSLDELESQVDGRVARAFGIEGTGRTADRDRPSLSVPPEEQVVGDFVSYAVGCMFGRYSLDQPGLILADQGASLRDYLARVPAPAFTPDEDNVIPIVDGDWFEDDIVARFREFLRVAFGEEQFEENLRFATESLGVKNLRDYFVKSFYADHVKRYKKRPIYWLFSSPKGSFNALIYMHRYTPSTVSTVLNEYLREYAAKLRASLEQQERLASGGGSPREQAAALKEADRLRRVLTELEEYEHDVLYPLASRQLAIDLDDGVKANYPKFGAALKKIPGLEASDE
ncbi:MAG: BREX-1 system adenine-specific DNA-methyltransferase PglX [Streptosporangiaceae bacterium]